MSDFFFLKSLGAPPRLCFEKYVDAIIDLLIPGHTPGIKDPIVDLYGKAEILFFGPDEGTADMMDWAACKICLFCFVLFCSKFVTVFFCFD